MNWPSFSFLLCLFLLFRHCCLCVFCTCLSLSLEVSIIDLIVNQQSLIEEASAATSSPRSTSSSPPHAPPTPGQQKPKHVRPLHLTGFCVTHSLFHGKCVSSTATVDEVTAMIMEELQAHSIIPPSLEWVSSNDICGGVFQTLTSENLTHLGVSSLGVCWLILGLKESLVNTTISGPSMHKLFMVPSPSPSCVCILLTIVTIGWLVRRRCLCQNPWW